VLGLLPTADACRWLMPLMSGALWPPGGPWLPPESTPQPSRSVREDDLVKVQRDPGIRRKCKSATQSRTLGRSDIEPVADEYAGLRIHMTKVLQRDRHFGKLRCSAELVVRCQLRYLADVLAERRGQARRGLIGTTGPREHVSKNNTRFNAHGLLKFGRPEPARAPLRDPGLVVLHHRMIRLKDLRIRSEGRHRTSPGLLSSRDVTGAARLQPAPAAMPSVCHAHGGHCTVASAVRLTRLLT
jgi:hypothetical protein